MLRIAPVDKPFNQVALQSAPDKARGVRAFWGWLTSVGRGKARQPISGAELRLARTTFRECLEGKGGEASARRRVETLASLYHGLNDAGRKSVLEIGRAHV